MKLRALYGSLGVVCISALTIAGLGWYADVSRSPEPAQRQVFCNLDELASQHPAWDQLLQVREMLPETTHRFTLLKGRGVQVSRGLDEDWREPTPISESRSSLQSKLEQKSQEEMSQIRSHLDEALERRLSERRQDLEARANAAEAEARRNSEQELAIDLRSLNEERQYERVDAAVKLSALKAQLGIDALARDEVEYSIASKESELNEIRSKLSKGEDDLRLMIESRAAQIGEDWRRSAEQELASIRDDETRRINDLLRNKCERLRYDLEGNGFGSIARNSNVGRTIASGGESAAKKAASAKIVTGISVKADGGDDRAALEKSLSRRIHTELEAIVRRIARQSDFKVIFENTGEVEDRTDWFRERLPYLSSRVKKNDRH